MIREALTAGKNVVTANKALIALQGAELMALAREHGVSLMFEASCAGGIPVIRALSDGLSANRTEALYGIVNGTCNFILSEMIQEGTTYREALKKAQDAGLAEADPTLDVSGMDSAHKLAILGSLAFGRNIDVDRIPVEGIDKLELTDLMFGSELGYTVKLLAIAKQHQDGISLRVCPVFISKEHPLAWVNGAFNAVSVYGSVVGHTMHYGRGAGGAPTASAVVADIISLALDPGNSRFQTMGIWQDRSKTAEQLPPEEIISRYYLRIDVKDEPGVFASVASLLADEKISLTSALQKEPADNNSNRAAVVFTTHTAKEGQINRALKNIEKLPSVEKIICLGIVDEHEENIRD